MTELTAALLRELLHYDPETGTFTWLVTRGKAKIGAAAGSPVKKSRGCDGFYLRIGIGGKGYRAGRLACLYMTGRWPTIYADHKDGDGLNDRWENLREASTVENSRNQKRSRKNTSGFKGVSFHRHSGLWRATIVVNKRDVSLGYFDTPDAGHAAYCAAATKHFGEFARAA